MLEGTWTSYVTGQEKPLVCVSDIFSFGGSVLKNFDVGERGPEINPKYARLGWNEVWENDEWWVEADSSAIQLKAASL